MKPDMDYIDKIIDAYSDRCTIYGATTEAEIKKASDKLELIFPADYLRFLKKYGALEFGSFEIYGILPDSQESIPDVVWVTKKLRNTYGLPHCYIVIGFDGFGGYICLDTRTANAEEGEVVVLFDFSEMKTDVNQEPIFKREVLFPTFSEYLFSEFKSEASSFCA